MKPDTLNKVKKLIASADPDELYELMDAIVSRRTVLRIERDRNAQMNLKRGDRVRFVNIRPKYMEKVQGVVTGIPTSVSPRKFSVEIIMPADPRAIRRFGKTVRCPGSCLEKVQS